jgi:hypothetical protein
VGLLPVPEGGADYEAVLHLERVSVPLLPVPEEMLVAGGEQGEAGDASPAISAALTLYLADDVIQQAQRLAAGQALQMGGQIALPAELEAWRQARARRRGAESALPFPAGVLLFDTVYPLVETEYLAEGVCGLLAPDQSWVLAVDRGIPRRALARKASRESRDVQAQAVAAAQRVVKKLGESDAAGDLRRGRRHVLWQDGVHSVAVEPLESELVLEVDLRCGRFFVQARDGSWRESPPDLAVRVRVGPQRAVGLLVGGRRAPSFSYTALNHFRHPFVSEEGNICLGPSAGALEEMIRRQQISRGSSLILTGLRHCRRLLRRGFSARTTQPFRDITASGWRLVDEAEARAAGWPMYYFENGKR